MMNGIGFHPTPSKASPVVLEAGRRAAISKLLNSRLFPFETTVVMYQAEIEGMQVIH